VLRRVHSGVVTEAMMAYEIVPWLVVVDAGILTGIGIEKGMLMSEPSLG
jgi:hypothetical protein